MRPVNFFLRRHSRSGFSLVEVAVAASISLLAIVCIYSVFITSSKMTVDSIMRNKTAMDARMVVDKLTADARMATSLETSHKTYSADANTLILKVPSIDADGFAVDPENEFDYIIYHQQGTAPVRFVRTVDADSDSARVSGSENLGDSATPGVYAVQPDSLGNFVIYYRFDSVQKRAGKTVQIPAAGTIQLRNHS